MIYELTSDCVEGKISVFPSINLSLDSLIFDGDELDLILLSHSNLFLLILWSDNLNKVILNGFADGLWNTEVDKDQCCRGVEGEDQEDVPFALSVVKEVQEDKVDDEVCEPSGEGSEGNGSAQEVVWHDLTSDSGDCSRKADCCGKNVEHEEEKECSSIGVLVLLSVEFIWVALISIVGLVHGVG